MILQRIYSAGWGVFGLLISDDSRTIIARTLEHAYPTPEKTFLPKVPEGQYTCQRGLHQLLGEASPFETFEVTNVPSHTGILFHTGNTNSDSAGCILLGDRIQNYRLAQSREAFERFMKLMTGVESFKLSVYDQKHPT